MAISRNWESSNDDISRRTFVLIMGITLILGLVLTAFCAHLTTSWMQLVTEATPDRHAGVNWVGPVNVWVFFIGTFLVALFGTWIASKSDNPIVSLFGFALVSGMLGLMLGPVVGMYKPESIVKVMFITATMVGVLGLIGVLIPKSLESWGVWLLGALTILIVGQFGIAFAAWLIPGFPVHGALTLWDWVGVVIFSGYVIYDMNQAMVMSATVDNAIDSALAIYLDITNLFLRLLELLGEMAGEAGD